MKKRALMLIIVSVLIGIICVTTVFFLNNTSNTTPYEDICEKGYSGTEDELYKALSDEEKNPSENEKQTLSAYDIATQKGYKGTKSDWLEALIGNSDNTNQYKNGKSVYDLAVDNGYSGSIENWLESLKEPLNKNESNKKASAADDTDNTDAENKTSTEQSEFTVIFRNYDGEELKTEVVKKGEAATPPTTPTREGYTFIGWDRTFNKIEFDTIINAQFKKIKNPAILVERVDSSAGEKKVAVNIAVKNNPGISSLNLNVSYAPELVLKDVKYNKDLKGQSMKPGQEESPITLTWVSPFENMTGDRVFATLYFDVSEDAKGDLPVCVTYNVENIYNMEEENIYFDVVDGAIAITK